MRNEQDTAAGLHRKMFAVSSILVALDSPEAGTQPDIKPGLTLVSALDAQEAEDRFREGMARMEPGWEVYGEVMVMDILAALDDGR